MNYLKYCFIATFSILLLSGCSDDEVDMNKDIITIDEGERTQFDEYLKKIYTDPYNVEFVYKWVDHESDMNYALVPARLEQSIQIANIVKYLALDAYDAVAPENFLKKYFPKQIMLVGSSAYRNNGTRVLGTAEGGVKITLYDINNLPDLTGLSDEDLEEKVEILFELYFRTIFHEFSHILHQNVDFSPAFQQISETDYKGGEWNEAWDVGESLAAGFISDYSSKEKNEDFVELIAHYVTHTPEQWQAILEAAGTSGANKINQKMEIVKTYMLEKWSIDLDELRDEVLQRAKTLNEIDLNNINS